MKSSFVGRVVVGLAAIAVLPGTALAQAAEIVGQPVQVTTNGITDTVSEPRRAGHDYFAGRHGRQRHLDGGKWAAVPEQRNGAGVLAL